MRYIHVSELRRRENKLYLCEQVVMVLYPIGSPDDGSYFVVNALDRAVAYLVVSPVEYAGPAVRLIPQSGKFPKLRDIRYIAADTQLSQACCISSLEKDGS